MTLFAEQPDLGEGSGAARLFAIPPGESFAERFAEGLRDRLAGQPPEAMAQVTLVINTRRSLRAVETALIEAAGGTTLLPRMTLVSDLAEDLLADDDLPPPVNRLRRRLHLTRLVQAYLQSGRGRAPLSAANDLAESLARLLDELQEEGVPLGRLDGLLHGSGLAESAAAHWTETLAFLDTVRAAWPAILAEDGEGALDPGARQRLAVERLVARWQAAPPAGPIIALGSTASRTPTAALLTAIAGLPQGAVVLPAFDPGIDPDIWESAGPEHPVAPFRKLLRALRLTPRDIPLWDGAPAGRNPRLSLLTQALRPAPVSDAWIAKAAGLRAEVEAATGGMTLIEAATPRDEAASIALCIRRGLAETGTRIAVVTPDAALARRVTAELTRFRVTPDDSLGRPLALSPAGVFLRMIAHLAVRPPAAVNLAALHTHPLCRAGVARGVHLRLARAYELEVLRGVAVEGPAPGTPPPWPRAVDTQAAWLGRIADALGILAHAIAEGRDLEALVACHRAAAEALSTGPDGSPIWEGADGEALDTFLGEFERAARGHGPVPDYPALFQALLGRVAQPADAVRPHPRVTIWGTQEARTQSADLVILAGLNEGTWPGQPDPDPWLSRPMREALGLPPPERQVGLAAHDFLQAACRPTVILTRALKVDGVPSVASRWLIRLESLLNGVDPAAMAAMRARGAEITGLVPLLHRPGPEHDVPAAPRPRPCPPVEARPRRISVTEVETLIRDAYAIYAKKVLRLAPLDPLGRAPDMRDRGQIIHTVLERFVRETKEALPPPDQAEALLLQIAQAVLAERIAAPDLRRIWRGRLARAAPWFVRTEAERRADAVPLALEVKGKLQVAPPGISAPVTLTARADRIDRQQDGRGVIYDYKSGTPPGAKEIEIFHQQLHLQGLILAAGGFDGIDPMVPASGAYLGMTGSGEGGSIRAVDDLAGVLDTHRERLFKLLAAYDLEETPYLSLGRPRQSDFEGDYDHLARRGEWQDGGA